MNKNILVTIVTPSYNQGQFIEETICSVLNQTYRSIQYILVDGGSVDHTMEIVEKYRDRIDIAIHEKDKGQSDAINKGFKLAKGELVGWLNSDDILYPTAVEDIVNEYLKNPNGSIYYAATIDVIDAQSNVINQFSQKIDSFNTLLRKQYDVIQPGSFYKTELVKEIGYIDETIYYCMDLDLWLRLLQKAPIYYFNAYPLACFRVWGESKTTTGGVDFARNIRKILRRYGASFYDISYLHTYYISLIIICSQLKTKILGRKRVQ